MNRERNNLCDSLLAQEHVNPELQNKYKEELDRMFTEKLSAPRTAGTFILAGLRLLIGLAEIVIGAFDYIPTFGIFNIPYPLGISFFVRFLLVAIGVFLILLSLKGLDVVRRGEYNLRRDVKHVAWLKSSLGWTSAFLFMMLGLTELIARREQMGTILITGALVLLVISALPLLFEKINRADLDTRQKLLEIELRLAALDERLQGRETRP